MVIFRPRPSKNPTLQGNVGTKVCKTYLNCSGLRVTNNHHITVRGHYLHRICEKNNKEHHQEPIILTSLKKMYRLTLYRLFSFRFNTRKRGGGGGGVI